VHLLQILSKKLYEIFCNLQKLISISANFMIRKTFCMKKLILPENIPAQIEVIDSHTGGEPTRLVLDGWPQPEGNSMQERLEFLRTQHDTLRQAVICEPRGHNAIIGALLTPPVNPESVTGVIFFNDVGYLGMCGHALIGTVATLKWLGTIDVGEVQIDTPAGIVKATIDEEGNILLANVESYLYKKDISLEVPGIGTVTGDISYGGNWFFLANSVKQEIQLSNIDELMATSKLIRTALWEAGHTGTDGAMVDHVEFFSAPDNEKADSKNFVLCPGNAYDRAPCGTGTSAKMATLHARGLLAEGQTWIQEGITGSLYEGRLEMVDGTLTPFIRSKAFVTSRSTLILNQNDPFCWGIS
jgi:4-hydroxyproline epimerase